MKIINKIFDTIYQHKFLSIILIVLLTSFMHGLNVWQYIIYNFDSLYLKENTQNFILDPIIQMSNNGAFILNLFNSILKPFLQIPILYIVMSIFIKSMIIYMIYLIIKKLIINKNLAFVISLFFIVSIGYAAHGTAVNGFWGAPIFFRSSVSGLMTLFGLYLMLKNRYYLAVIPFALSIHLHVLYGVTALAFIFTSFMFYSFMHSNKYLKELIVLIVMSGLSVLIIILNIDSTTFVTIDSSIEQWYKYIFSTDPDDMSMLYFLGTEGYFASPFLFLSIYFYFKNQDRQMIDYLFMGSFILLVIIMFVELLHYNSIFLGGLSEKFIGVQFRRGIWILFLFSTIINFFNIQKIIDSEDNKYLYVLISCYFLYLLPNIIVLYITFFILLIYFKKYEIIYLMLLSILFLSIGVILDFYSPGKLYKNFGFILVLAILVGGLIHYKIIEKRNILLTVLLFFVFSTSSLGLIRGNRQKDLNIITNNGFFRYPTLLKLEKEIYKSQGKIINNKIIDYIRTHNPKKEFVLESMENISYGDTIIYNSPLFISRGGIGMPMFSMLYYERLLYTLNIFQIEETQLHNSKDDTLRAIDNHISRLSKKEMKKLYQNYRIKFLITHIPFFFLQPIVEENGYFLYDIGTLK